MFNKFALVAALALPLGVLGISGSAMAGYSPTSHTPIARTPLQMRGALSCAAARQMIRADGYRNVIARDCDARNYAFSATRHGRAIVLRINPRNGHMWHA